MFREKSEKCLKKAPDGTGDILSNVNVFTDAQKSMKPENLAVPFICNKDVKLSDYELRLLSKGPGFMLRECVDNESFEVELEKMVAKNKFNSWFSNKGDISAANLDEDLGNGHPNHLTKTSDQLRGNQNVPNRVKSNGVVSNDELWEENSGSMVFNYKTKSLDFGNLTAPKYKYNKTIGMPNPESCEKETFHEIRRNEMRRIFSKATSSQPVNKRQSPSKPNGNGNIDSNESNLTREELIRLESLKRRIKAGELCISSTDKSKRFAILSNKQNIESGLQHTSKDLEIEPSKVKRVQNYVNDHVSWLKAITNIGSNFGHESRMGSNLCDK